MINVNLKPSDAMLRTFALVGIVAFGVIALTLALFGRIVFFRVAPGAVGPTMWVFVGLAAWCAVGRFLLPQSVLPLYVVMTLISYPIGFVMSYLILGILYYVVLTPIGFVFRLIGRDAMTRKFEPAAATYWTRRKPADPRRYLRQF